MYENDIKIVDNFFPKYIEKEIQQLSLSNEPSWKFLSTLSYDKPDDETKSWSTYGNVKETDGFLYLFDKNTPAEEKIKGYLSKFIELHYNIKIKKFIRVMLVMIPPNPLYDYNYHLTPHVDREDIEFKNFLYYINDNDAETLFFDQRFQKNKPIDFSRQEVVYRVKPKRGRGVLWDGSIFHSGNVSKIEKRLSLNVNFV